MKILLIKDFFYGGISREDFKTKKRNFRVWQNKNVPILVRNVNYGGIEFPVFISVKPTNARILENHKRLKSSPLVVEGPHIRGVVAELTEDFLFWFPITYDEPQFLYSTTTTSFWEGVNEPVLSTFLHPSQFWKKQIKKSWPRGKRHHTRPEVFDFCNEGYKIVPYYEFNSNENHIMIYPGKIFEDRLDLPIVIKGIKGNDSGIPEILGVGYFNFDEFSVRDMKREDRATYWKLDNAFEQKAKRSLITRLGNLRKK